MKYEIGGYWIFKAGGKRKALPLLKRFIPSDIKIFSRIAKENDAKIVNSIKIFGKDTIIELFCFAFDNFSFWMLKIFLKKFVEL